MKEKTLIKKITLSAISVILIYFFTTLISIPMPLGSGYLNLGDSVIFLFSIILGPLFGPLSAILGSILADLTNGYALFVPFTIIAKGLESLLVSVIYHRLKKYKFIALIIGSLIMILVYLLSYYLLYGSASLISSLFDLIQAIINIPLGLIYLKIYHYYKRQHHPY